MTPVTVDVDIIELGLDVRRAVTELRAGDRLPGLQIAAHKSRHAGPIAGFRRQQKAQVVALRLGRHRFGTDRDGGYRSLSESLERFGHLLGAGPQREIVQLIPPDLEARELQDRPFDILAGLEHARDGFPRRPDVHQLLQAQRAPTVRGRCDRHAEFPRSLAFGAPDPEGEGVKLTFFQRNLPADHLGEVFAPVAGHRDLQHAVFDGGLAGAGAGLERPPGVVEHERGVETALRELLLSQRLVFPCPGGLKRGRVGIGLVQPVIPLAAQFGGVGIRQTVKRAAQIGPEQRVLVADFDHRDARFIGVGVAGVGVDVGQEFARVLFLQLDHARLKLADAFVGP